MADSLIINSGFGGPFVEVTADVAIDRAAVGLIAVPRRGRGWTELTPDEARRVARALIEAADETERNPGG